MIKITENHEENHSSVVSHIKYRHSQLEGIKSPHMIEASYCWNEFNDFDCDKNKFKVNIYYAQVMAFLAGTYASIPKYNWIGIDDI
jgi:hypothetical protein